MTHSPFAGVQFTEEQRKSIRDMMARQREVHEQRVERMQALRSRLRELYAAEIWDAEAIGAAYAELFAEQRKSIEAMAKARNEVYEMLSDEQRAQMRQTQQQMQRSGPVPKQTVTNPGQ